MPQVKLQGCMFPLDAGSMEKGELKFHLHWQHVTILIGPQKNNEFDLMEFKLQTFLMKLVI